MRKPYVWMLTVIWLAILNMLKQSVWEEKLSLELNEQEICEAMIALSWLLLRVTSFAIDYCNARDNCQPMRNSEQIRDDCFSTLHYLSYSFYLPVFLHGPPLIYERYARMFPKNQLLRIEESLCRLKELFLSLIRIGCIYLLNEFCMHFIYANVVIYNPDVSNSIYFFRIQNNLLINSAMNKYWSNIQLLANGTYETLGGLWFRLCDWPVFL